ncbi:MAG: PIN domain-containing protein [Euryarchaeota archaeon]|nr:PIN domain-containing protein [Euryarchaeota archaeon]
MKPVLDTNIVIAALLRDSTSRAILASPVHTFILPEHGRAEIERHLDDLVARMGMSRDEAELLLALITARVETVPESDFRSHLPEARKIMHDLDPEDAVFVAVALSVPCDGIWTQDKALRKQTRVRTFTTAEMVETMDNAGTRPQKG